MKKYKIIRKFVVFFLLGAIAVFATFPDFRGEFEYWLSYHVKKNLFGIRLYFFINKKNVNNLSDEGRTALSYPVEWGQFEWVEKLLKMGADPNLADLANRETALHFSAHETKQFSELDTNKLKIVKLLVQSGANVNAQDIYGNTPIYCWAATPMYDDLIRKDIIQFLLDNGANADIANKRGLIPLTIYRWIYNYDTVFILIDNTKELNHMDINGRSILWHIVAKYPDSLLNIRTALLNKNVDLDAQDGNGNTALIEAIIHEHRKETAKLLIKHGADVNLKNSDGKTALDYVREMGDSEMVTLLENYKDIPKIKNQKSQK